MTTPQAPKLDTRRTADFFAELRDRARAWIPAWGFADNEGDFGGALLQIAARFNSEVAERLDGAGEKMRRGFLDWLAVRGLAARPSRMPVVFKLADTAQTPVLARAPIQMQAPAGDASVVFETETDVNILPGTLQTIVGVDGDALYLPPPGLSSLQPPEAVPTQWQLKSFVSAGSVKLQLDPDAGLVAGMIVAVGTTQYSIVAAANGIATVDPPLAADLTPPATIQKVSSFTPFDPGTQNSQKHALYLGHMDVLNIDAEATIDVIGATTLADGVAWQFWGTVNDDDDPAWLALENLGVAAGPARVVLHKPKAKMIPLQIDNINSRWIRAFTTSVVGTQPLLSVDTVTLRINCTDSSTPGGVVAPVDVSPTAEAMDNTTPIVLNGVFFPLGKVPRQFDAFYIGSQEAFSKPGAKVQLAFTMAEATFFSLTAVPAGAFADKVLAGVGADSALHLLEIDATTGAVSDFKDREPLQPPQPGYNGATSSVATVALDKQPRWRLSVWQPTGAGSANVEFAVATTAGKDVWVWLERGDDFHKSGWAEFGPLPTTASDDIAGLVYLEGAIASLLVALQGQNLWIREWTAVSPPNVPDWAPVATTDAGVNVKLEALVPILDVAGLVTSVTNDLVGVSDGNTLYTVDLTGACTALGPLDADFDVQPVAVLNAANELNVIYAKTGLNAIVALWQGQPDVTINLAEADAKVAGLDVFLDASNQIEFLASVVHASGSYTLAWAPTSGGAAPIVSRTEIPATAGTPGGAPTVFDGRVVIPGDQADLLAAPFDVTASVQQQAQILGGIVLPSSAPALLPNDQVARVGGVVEACTVTDHGTTQGGEVFYPVTPSFTTASSGPLLAYPAASQLTGTPTVADQFTVDPLDHEITDGSFVLVNGTVFKISLQKVPPPWVVTAVGLGAPVTVTYCNPLPTGGRVAPYMSLDPNVNGNWPASLLDRAPVSFPSENPSRQPAKAFATDVAGHPTLVALLNEFTAPPANPATFVIDGSIGAWERLLGDSSANPELSWEYSNGRSWSKLPDETDDTGNLKNSGSVTFTVPIDIAPSDWAGKTDFWIRARLIGGDYGQEQVTVTTKDLGGGVTQQTVERSAAGIRAPSVIQLAISYSISTAILPEAVLAEDSGSILDQTDANRTGGATVEAFVPLPVLLGKLSANSTAPAQRALFIGLSAAASGASVNVLLLVDEREHSAFTPLAIDALVANEFQPIVASDATRALGESGLLTLAFNPPPTQAALFGQSLTWLRLTPRGSDVSQWKPAIRGAYLNGVWASATETLTRELVGSSEGAPNLTLTLARPPVLDHTLELRVREPLGDEEVAALLAQDENAVKIDQDLAGNWVLWEQVPDPADAAPQDRVYALDESTGEIQFGDGIHGMIPPIGTDSIVAFRYQRTEAGPPGSSEIPGNEVGARTVLGLVSPLATVESAIAADQSADGALPESADRVVQFGFARLRHRSRAVTAADVEDLILETSPDIAQARCLLKRGAVRIVVVMRGADPIPGAARLRELTRRLLTVVPSSLSTSNAVTAVKPTTRTLRIYMDVVVDSLDNAAALTADATTRVASLLDPSTGGTQHDGWLLGASPTADDVALALIDTAHLESIVDVTLRVVDVDGTEDAWPATLAPTELVVLDEPIRIQFQLVEAAA